MSTPNEIYDDLDDFELNIKLNTINIEKDELLKENIELKEKVERQSKEIDELKKLSERLKRNISSLYRTARHISTRKHKTITMLQAEMENIKFRRHSQYSNKHSLDFDETDNSSSKRLKVDHNNVSERFNVEFETAFEKEHDNENILENDSKTDIISSTNASKVSDKDNEYQDKFKACKLSTNDLNTDFKRNDHITRQQSTLPKPSENIFQKRSRRSETSFHHENNDKNSCLLNEKQEVTVVVESDNKSTEQPHVDHKEQSIETNYELRSRYDNQSLNNEKLTHAENYDDRKTHLDDKYQNKTTRNENYNDRQYRNCNKHENYFRSKSRNRHERNYDSFDYHVNYSRPKSHRYYEDDYRENHRTYNTNERSRSRTRYSHRPDRKQNRQNVYDEDCKFDENDHRYLRKNAYEEDLEKHIYEEQKGPKTPPPIEKKIRYDENIDSKYNSVEGIHSDSKWSKDSRKHPELLRDKKRRSRSRVNEYDDFSKSKTRRSRSKTPGKTISNDLHHDDRYLERSRPRSRFKVYKNIDDRNVEIKDELHEQIKSLEYENDNKQKCETRSKIDLDCYRKRKNENLHIQIENSIKNSTLNLNDNNIQVSNRIICNSLQKIDPHSQNDKKSNQNLLNSEYSLEKTVFANKLDNIKVDSQKITKENKNITKIDYDDHEIDKIVESVETNNFKNEGNTTCDDNFANMQENQLVIENFNFNTKDKITPVEENVAPEEKSEHSTIIVTNNCDKNEFTDKIESEKPNEEILLNSITHESKDKFFELTADNNIENLKKSTVKDNSANNELRIKNRSEIKENIENILIESFDEKEFSSDKQIKNKDMEANKEECNKGKNGNDIVEKEIIKICDEKEIIFENIINAFYENMSVDNNKEEDSKEQKRDDIPENGITKICLEKKLVSESLIDEISVKTVDVNKEEYNNVKKNNETVEEESIKMCNKKEILEIITDEVCKNIVIDSNEEQYNKEQKKIEEKENVNILDEEEETSTAHKSMDIESIKEKYCKENNSGETDDLNVDKNSLNILKNKSKDNSQSGYFVRNKYKKSPRKSLENITKKLRSREKMNTSDTNQKSSQIFQDIEPFKEIDSENDSKIHQIVEKSTSHIDENTESQNDVIEIVVDKNHSYVNEKVKSQNDCGQVVVEKNNSYSIDKMQSQNDEKAGIQNNDRNVDTEENISHVNENSESQNDVRQVVAEKNNSCVEERMKLQIDERQIVDEKNNTHANGKTESQNYDKATVYEQNNLHVDKRTETQNNVKQVIDGKNNSQINKKTKFRCKQNQHKDIENREKIIENVTSSFELNKNFQNIPEIASSSSKECSQNNESINKVLLKNNYIRKNENVISQKLNSVSKNSSEKKSSPSITNFDAKSVTKTSNVEESASKDSVEKKDKSPFSDLEKKMSLMFEISPKKSSDIMPDISQKSNTVKSVSKTVENKSLNRCSNKTTSQNLIVKRDNPKKTIVRKYTSTNCKWNKEVPCIVKNSYIKKNESKKSSENRNISTLKNLSKEIPRNVFGKNRSKEGCLEIVNEKNIQKMNDLNNVDKEITKDITIKNPSKVDIIQKATEKNIQKTNEPSNKELASSSTEMVNNTPKKLQNDKTTLETTNPSLKISLDEFTFLIDTSISVLNEEESSNIDKQRRKSFEENVEILKNNLMNEMENVNNSTGAINQNTLSQISENKLDVTKKSDNVIGTSHELVPLKNKHSVYNREIINENKIRIIVKRNRRK